MAEEPSRKTEPQIKLMTITPDMARDMLGHNDNNRHVSQRRVKLLAREMASGGWQVNGDSIRFGANGRLLDGQHRLHACIAADKPFDTYVITGLPDRAQETMDTGKPRTLGDVMRLRGETGSTQLAGILKIVYLTDQLGLEAAICDHGQLTPTRTELLEFFEQTPQIRTLAEASSEFYRRSGHLLTRAVFAALWWELSHVDNVAAESFFDRLASGAGLEVGDPVLTLRNALINESQKHDRGIYARTRMAALTVKAWNRWRAGRSLKQLKWSAGERFPEAK